MRVILVFLLCTGLLAGAPAEAGAWLREKGSGFLATSAVLRGPTETPQLENRIYAEYGLLRHLTLGIDLNHKTAVDETELVAVQTGHAVLFLRVPLAPESWRTRYALELGLGRTMRETGRARMSSLALAVGRGFERPFGGGWMSLQATIEHHAGMAGRSYKLDSSVGLSNGRMFRPMLRLEASRVADAPVSWSLIPAIQIGRGDRTAWVLGVEHRFGPIPRTGVELAIWREF